MTSSLRIILSILGIVLLLVVLYYLRTIVAYVLIAAVLALIGRPLANLLQKVKIGKFRIPGALAAALTLATMLGILVGFVSIFIPLVIEEAQLISKIDYQQVAEGLEKPLGDLETWLDQYHLSDDPNQSNFQYLSAKASGLVSVTKVTDIFGGLFGALGNLFIALFSVLFISFFFLKDQHLLTNFIFAATPDKHMEKVKNVLRNARNTLSRYFIGLVVQISLITTLVTVGLLIFGVKNALVIGFFAGIINVIPYVGPLIGASFGILITLSTNLDLQFSTELLPLLFEIAAVFLVVQLLDNFVFQPFIFSNSVSIHPLEVFLVILIAGTLAGISGMILAIPTYSFIRIIAGEFLSQFKLVQTMKRGEK